MNTTSVSENLIHEQGDWLSGYVDVHPYVGIGLVALAIVGTAYYLWRRFRARKRDGQLAPRGARRDQCGLPAQSHRRRA